MKRNINYLVLICYFLSLINNLLGQNLSQSLPILFLPNGVVSNQLTGKGFVGSTGSSISNMNVGNPAAITDFSDFSVGISFHAETEIKDSWIIGDHSRNNYLPQSFGVSYKLRKTTIALASNQIFNTRIDYGKIVPTLVADNEQGYIELDPIYPKNDETIFQYSAIVAHQFENILLPSSLLNFGVSVNYNWFSIEEDLGKSTLKTQLTEPNITVGFRYDYSGNRISSMKFGLYYESKLKFEDEVESGDYTMILKGILPPKLHSGISIELPDNIILSTDFTYHLWNSIDTPTFQNHYELRNTILFQAIKSIKISLGSKYTNRDFDNRTGLLFDKSSLFAHYFTFGCVYDYKNYEVAFVIADSHLFSDDWNRQTIVKMGIGYTFGKNNK